MFSNSTVIIIGLYRSCSDIKLIDILLNIGCNIRKHIPNRRIALNKLIVNAFAFFFKRYPFDLLFLSQKPSLATLAALLFVLVIVVNPL